MKQLVCEMCGSTDLVKDGGVFVCQSCGCKYSVEEAKKMMVEGTVEVAGTVKVDKSSEADHYLELANSMFESGNWSQAEQYAAKVLEVSTDNARAWYIRGCAVNMESTLADDKFPEMVSCFRKAATKLGNDLEANDQLSTDSDMNLFLEITMHSLTAVQNRIEAWSKAFADGPGDKGARDRLVEMLPTCLDGYRAMMAYIENTIRSNKEGLRASFIANGATEEQADEWIQKECLCFNHVGGNYVYAVTTVCDKAITPASSKMASVVTSADGLGGKYAAAGACEDAKGYIIDVADAMEKLCDAPCLVYYFENNDTVSNPVGISALKYKVAEAKSVCLATYEQILVVKNQTAKLVRMPEDSAGSLIIMMEKIVAAASLMTWGFEKRKLEKAQELVEEKNKGAVKAAQDKAYQQALDEYSSSHSDEAAERESNRAKLAEIDKKINDLKAELSGLGMFSGKRKKQINAEISELNAERTKLDKDVKAYDSRRKKHAETKKKDAAKIVKAASVKLEPAECFLQYDVDIVIGNDNDSFDGFVDFAWKQLQIPVGRYKDNYVDGKIRIAEGVTFEFIAKLQDLLDDSGYNLEFKPYDYEHITDGSGLSVVIKKIDNIAGGSDEDTEATKQAKKRKNVARSIAHYLPVDISEYEKQLKLPKTIASDLPEKVAYALAADLATRGAEIEIK